MNTVSKETQFVNTQAITNAIKEINKDILKYKHDDDEYLGELYCMAAVQIDYEVIKKVDQWFAEQSETMINKLIQSADHGFTRTDGTYVLFALANDIMIHDVGISTFGDLKNYDDSDLEDIVDSFFDQTSKWKHWNEQ